MWNLRTWLSRYINKTKFKFILNNKKKSKENQSLINNNKDFVEFPNYNTTKINEESDSENSNFELYIDPETLEITEQQPETKWEKFKTRLPYYIPILKWLPEYNFKTQFFGDFISGITVASLIVPQSLSYALLAGLPSVFGLYSAFIPLIIYTIFGSSKQLSLGPESMVSILVGSVISNNIVKQNDTSTIFFDNSNSDPFLSSNVIQAGIICFLSGLFTLILGIFRFGFLDNILSRPVTRGFVTAIALIITVEQFDKVFGFEIPHNYQTHFKIIYIFKNITKTKWLTFGIGIASIGVLIIFKIFKKLYPKLKILTYIPGILVVVTFWLILSKTINLQKEGVDILGEVRSGFPKFTFPILNGIDYITTLLQPSIIIAIAGFVESIIVCKTYARKYQYAISANRELVAFGMSNLIGSFFGSYPAYGSLSRSSVNDMAGCKTQLSGFITSIVVLLTMLFLTPVFYYLPKVVMGSIIVVAAAGLVEFHDILFLFRIKAWIEISLMLFVFLFTIIFGIETGMLATIGISLFMVIKHTTIPHISILGRIPNTNKFKDIYMFPEAIRQEGLLIVRIEEALFFANINQVKDMFYRIEKLGSMEAHPSSKNIQPPLKYLIVQAKNIPHIDASAIQILREMVMDYKERGIKVCFVKLTQSVKKSFLLSGILDEIGSDMIFSSILEAINYLEGKLTSHSSYIS